MRERALLAACYAQMERVDDAREQARMFINASQIEIKERGDPVLSSPLHHLHQLAKKELLILIEFKPCPKS